MDFKRSEKQLNLEEHWAHKVARKFEGTIPVLTKLPKDGEKSDIRFRGLSRLINLASTICTVSHNRFKHVGEVHRAAHYIGMNILFNMYGKQDKNVKSYGSDMYEVLKVNEQYRAQCTLIDDMLDGARDILKAASVGIMSYEQRDANIQELIDSLPPNLRKLAASKILELRGGSNVTDIKEMTTRGGDRKSKKALG
jgi:hypothetical protein